MEKKKWLLSFFLCYAHVSVRSTVTVTVKQTAVTSMLIRPLYFMQEYQSKYSLVDHIYFQYLPSSIDLQVQTLLLFSENAVKQFILFYLYYFHTEFQDPTLIFTGYALHYCKNA
jgi:hypothetical protein